MLPVSEDAWSLSLGDSWSHRTSHTTHCDVCAGVSAHWHVNLHEYSHWDSKDSQPSSPRPWSSALCSPRVSQRLKSSNICSCQKPSVSGGLLYILGALGKSALCANRPLSWTLPSTEKEGAAAQAFPMAKGQGPGSPCPSL